MNAHSDDFDMADDFHDLSRAYRNAIGREDAQEPSPALDAAILAAAHRSVASRPQAVARQPLARWRWPLALAASVLVSVLVTRLFVPVGTEPEAPVLAQAPVLAEEPELAQAPEQVPLLQIPPPPQASMEVRDAPELARASALPRATANKSVAETQKPEPAVQSLAERKRDAPVEFEAAAMKSEEAPSAMPVMPKQPQAWLEEIEKLRHDGKIKEARESLAEFRKHYPDHELPEALRDL